MAGWCRVPGRGGAVGQYRGGTTTGPGPELTLLLAAVEGLEYRVAVAAHRLQPPPGARTVAMLHNHGQQLRYSDIEAEY